MSTRELQANDLGTASLTLADLRVKWAGKSLDQIVDDVCQELMRGRKSFSAYQVTLLLRGVFPEGTRRIAHDTGMPTADVRHLVPRCMDQALRDGTYERIVREVRPAVYAWVYYPAARTAAPTNGSLLPPVTAQAPASPIQPSTAPSDVFMTMTPSVPQTPQKQANSRRLDAAHKNCKLPQVVRRGSGKIDLKKTVRAVAEKEFSTRLFSVKNLSDVLVNKYGIIVDEEQVRRALVRAADIDDKVWNAAIEMNRPLGAGLLMRYFQKNIYQFTPRTSIKRQPIIKKAV